MSNGSIESTRRRVLVLAARNPYPVNSGDCLRIHRLARALSSRFHLTLVTFCSTWEERNAPVPSDGVFRKVHRVVLPQWQSWLNMLKALPTSMPLQIAWYKSAEFRELVEELAPSHDAVVAHLMRTAAYAASLPAVRILEMTHADSMRLKRMSGLRGCTDIRRLLYHIDARRMPAYERRLARAFDTVFLTSMADRNFLFDVSEDKFDRVMIVPNGVDAPLNEPLPFDKRNPGEIAFVGDMNDLANFDGVWKFAKQVLPLIRSQRPDANLRIIGPIRPFARHRLEKLPGVRVEGPVASISQALATARIGICPTRAGAGISNKILDYMANGLAVVTSRIGNEGLNARPDHELLLADSRLDWSSKMLRLLHDDDLGQRLAEGGRRRVEKNHRWGNCMLPAVRRLEMLCTGAAPKASTRVDSRPTRPQAGTGR